MSFKDKLKHEAKEVGIVSLYFAICFVSIVSIKALLLTEYQVQFYGYSAALIGALIVGKVVVILNATSFGKRFAEGRVVYHVLYLSLIYTFWVFVAVVLEHSLEEMGKVGSFGVALDSLLVNMPIFELLAKSLCVFFSFIGFNAFTSISRSMGPGKLFELFFSKTTS